MYWQWITGAVAAVLAAYFAFDIGTGLTVFSDFVQEVYPAQFVNRMYEPTPASAAVKHEMLPVNITGTARTTPAQPFVTNAKEDEAAGTAKETSYWPPFPPLRWRGFLTLIWNEVLQLMTALLILEGRMFHFLKQRLHLCIPFPAKGIETNDIGVKIRHLKKRLNAAKMQQLVDIASNAREERDSLKLALEAELEEAKGQRDKQAALLTSVRNERDNTVKELKEQITGLEMDLLEKRLELEKQARQLEELQLARRSVDDQITSLQINEEKREKETAELRATIDALIERGNAFFNAEQAVEDKGKGRAEAGDGDEEKEAGEAKASADAGEKKKKRRRRRRGKKGGAAAEKKVEEGEEGEAAGDNDDEEEPEEKKHEE
ncbi:MAG: hypothetical protein Q9167_002539 [Letrouitia subvulpina]